MERSILTPPNIICQKEKEKDSPEKKDSVPSNDGTLVSILSNRTQNGVDSKSGRAESGYNRSRCGCAKEWGRMSRYGKHHFQRVF